MKPMLAATVKDLVDVRYPVLVSPKLDGIRAIVRGGVVLSRSLKPIPNKHVQGKFGRPLLEGLDGELLVSEPNAKDAFNRTSSGVMAKEGRPDVWFYVFDDLTDPSLTFTKRLDQVHRRLRYDYSKELRFDSVLPIPHQLVKDVDEALHQEMWMLQDGWEGMMLRDPNGLYKHGRSTLKEGGLLKLKRFMDGEAEILGMTELMHNANEVQVNELGENERSHKKAGMVGKGLMGSLLVRDLKTGIEFEIGTGFNETQRGWFWNTMRPSITWSEVPGPIVKYKYQAVGVKDKPRFPVFLGLRDQRDLS